MSNSDSINAPSQNSAPLFNRELSWLSFNSRVLEEAENPNVPILERLKFLSISAMNLKEFTMVRVAGLMDQANHHPDAFSRDGLSPAEQLEQIQRATAELASAQQTCFQTLSTGLNDTNIEITNPETLSEAEEKWLEHHFQHNIFPVLTPIALDPAHPFPFLPNLSMAQLFKLKHNASGKKQVVIIPMPQTLKRFINLKEKDTRFILLEDLITRYIEEIVPGFDIVDSGLIHIIRDSDLDIEEDAEDLLRHFERAVKKRRRGKVIQVSTSASISTKLLDVVMEHLEVGPSNIRNVEHMLGLNKLSELYSINRPDLKFPTHNVRFPERIIDYDGDCFAAISAKDIVVHHPFESFDVVVQFLNQAAGDPDVVSIKQTLYRTGKDSPIVAALIEAAEAGKAVTALIELKARFDEEANLGWARDMERVGVQVVYGFVKLKTHAKLSLVTRREEGELKSYAHFGTGNYHSVTAKVYTDLSFFTCNEELCHDAALLFNYITGYGEPKTFKHLITAPSGLRKNLMALIEAEIAHAKAGEPATIWAKMNALVDHKIIEKLYEASCAGVQIDLVVRGICCLKPGILGLSENIRVKSIIGRFLEHSRIYCFGAGKRMPSKQTKVYISSADWMPRNLDWRVEVMVPILNNTVHEQILKQIMVANMRDSAQSWYLQPDGSYIRSKSNKDDISAHNYFMENPSLSGRGTALKKR